jgi:RND family efflux transporter MFP subunit
MKILRNILIALGVVGVILLVLFNNKAKSDARAARRDILSSLPVSVTTVKRVPLTRSLSLVGTLIANSDVNVLSETSGRIVASSFEIGQHLSKGQVIVRVDDELRRAAVTQAEIAVEKAQSDVQRYEQLIKEQAISEQQVEAARLQLRSALAQLVTARRLQRDTRITAPISGVVTQRFVNTGATLSPGTPIVQIVDISRLKVKVNVAERDVFKLHVGDPVTITSDVYPGVIFDGHVLDINSKSDEAHTYPVEISLINNTSHPLKAGMFGRVAFTSLPSAPVITVPRSAIIGSVQKPQVFVVKAGRVALRDIQIGEGAGLDVEVINGLSVGETVVIDGQNNLSDGTTVSVVK